MRENILEGTTFSGATLRRKREKGRIRTFSKNKTTPPNLIRTSAPQTALVGVESGMLAKAELWQTAGFYPASTNIADCLKNEADR